MLLRSAYHILRIKGFVKFFFRKNTLLKHDIIDRAVGLQGFLSHLGAGFITDDRVQGRYYADTVLYHLVATLLIDRDAIDALFTKRIHSVGKPRDALHYGFCDHRLHDIQLKLSCLGCK